MELRWIVFIGLCLFIGLLVMGYDRVLRKTTVRDRDHSLNPPKVSDGTNSLPPT